MSHDNLVQTVEDLVTLQVILESAGEKPVIIDFFAVWCPPCQAIKPKYHEWAKQFEGKVIFCQVDVDQASELVAAMQISAMPTFKFFKNGSEIHSIRGADAQGILNKLNELVK